MKIFMNEGVIKESDKCLIMFSKTFWAFYYKYQNEIHNFQFQSDSVCGKHAIFTNNGRVSRYRSQPSDRYVPQMTVPRSKMTRIILESRFLSMEMNIESMQIQMFQRIKNGFFPNLGKTG